MDTNILIVRTRPFVKRTTPFATNVLRERELSSHTGERPVIDSMVLRRAVGAFATGVTVVTVSEGTVLHGMTANSFTSVSLSPPLVLVSVDKKARMHAVLPRVGRFGMSVLASDQGDVAMHFAGRPGLDGCFAFASLSGTPVIDHALAQLACSLVASQDAGDHTLYIGKVDDTMRRDGRPLVFFAGRFVSLTTEKEAPSVDFQQLIDSIETYWCQ